MGQLNPPWSIGLPVSGGVVSMETIPANGDNMKEKNKWKYIV